MIIFSFSLMLYQALIHDAAAEQFVSTGVSSVLNDPFLKRRGINAKYGFAISDRLYVGPHVQYDLDLGDSDLSTLTKQIKDSNNVAPDISRALANVSFSTWYHFRETQGLIGKSNNPLNIDLYFGPHIGLIQTKDDGTVSGILDTQDNICPDISTLNSNSEQALFCQTQEQWHPSSGIELMALWSVDRTFVSTGYRSVTYIETVNSTMLEMKNLSRFEIGLGWRL